MDDAAPNSAPALPSGSDDSPIPFGSDDPPIPFGSDDPPLPFGSEDPPIPFGSEDPPIPFGSEDPPDPSTNSPRIPKRIYRAGTIAILLLAVVLRLWAIDFGLPHLRTRPTLRRTPV